MSGLVQRHEVTGIVTGVLANSITAIPVEDCGKNGENGHTCTGGCGSCSGKKRIRAFTLPLDDSLQVHTGQQIRFRYHALHETVGALLVFGLPLGFAVATLLVWQTASPDRAESGIALLSSGIALLLGFAVVRIVDRFFSRNYPPELLSADPTGEPPAPSRKTETNG